MYIWDPSIMLVWILLGKIIILLASSKTSCYDDSHHIYFNLRLQYSWKEGRRSWCNDEKGDEERAIFCKYSLVLFVAKDWRNKKKKERLTKQEGDSHQTTSLQIEMVKRPFTNQYLVSGDYYEENFFGRQRNSRQMYTIRNILLKSDARFLIPHRQLKNYTNQTKSSDTFPFSVIGGKKWRHWRRIAYQVKV